MTMMPAAEAPNPVDPHSIVPADGEQLREMLLVAHQQLRVAQAESADLNLLVDALQTIVADGEDADPFVSVFAVLGGLFRFAHAVVLVDSPAAGAARADASDGSAEAGRTPMLRCAVATLPELVDSRWPMTSAFTRVLNGRVVATVPRPSPRDDWPTVASRHGITADQPALFLPLRAREQRGLMMLLRPADDDGFDRRDVAVARRLSVLASQALATRQGNRAESERRQLKTLTDELRTARDKLAYRADHDELTGLANRSYFDRKATAAFANIGTGQRIGIAFIDVDGFKQVNDHYGHDVGDRLLVAVAQRLRSYALDDTDVVARISGDEFMILVNPVTDPDTVMRMVHRGLDQMRAPFDLGDHQLLVSASVGMAFYPEHGTTYDDLRRNADIAMYRAKRAARGSALVYEPSMGAAIAHRLEREQDLRRAIASRRFRAVMQPKVDLAAGRVIGFEALARQMHADGVLGTSANFIEIASQTGLLDEITAIVIDDALRTLPDLDRAFGDDTVININISTRQATDPSLLERLLHRLRRAGIVERVMLEVTEDALLADEVFQNEIMPMVTAAGARVSIDDFGTGYASLSRLLTVSADEIKIDRSFVTAIHRRPRSQVMLGAMETIANELGATIVAEGIETDDELRYLVQSTGVRAAQGYLFARPAPAVDLVRDRDALLAELAELSKSAQARR